MELPPDVKFLAPPPDFRRNDASIQEREKHHSMPYHFTERMRKNFDGEAKKRIAKGGSEKSSKGVLLPNVPLSTSAERRVPAAASPPSPAGVVCSSAPITGSFAPQVGTSRQESYSPFYSPRTEPPHSLPVAQVPEGAVMNMRHPRVRPPL